jgi:hypothetical protein
MVDPKAQRIWRVRAEFADLDASWQHAVSLEGEKCV